MKTISLDLVEKVSQILLNHGIELSDFEWKTNFSNTEITSLKYLYWKTLPGAIENELLELGFIKEWDFDDDTGTNYWYELKD